MKWLEIFKIYSLKQISKEKILFIFTSLSILLATSISIIIPVVNIENERYFESNIKSINGGDLSISITGKQTKKFQDKLLEFKNRGLKVESIILETCYYVKSSNDIMGTMVIGDYNLKEDEIILHGNLASSLNVKVGDYVEIDTKGNGKIPYKVKEIERVSSGVDRDAELLGYGKVQNSERVKDISGREIIHINGGDGESLKKELINEESANWYTTIDDRKKSVKDESLIQKTSLGVLSVVGYIFSTLSIISTIIMIILKRKRDIAILRLVSIDKKDIKRAMVAEVSLWLLCPIILSGILSYYGSSFILNISGIEFSKTSGESFSLILKGMFFNGLIFFLLINVGLIIVNGINAMSVIREDHKKLKRQKTKVVVFTVIAIPIFIATYALYSKNLEGLLGSVIVIIIIGVFLGLVSLVIKLLSLMRFRNPLFIYSIKSIKNRFFSFVLVILSLTLTLWFILIGFNLEASIKENFRSAFSEILPYDYYIKCKDNEFLEKVLKSNGDVKGYIKTASIDGKVVNEKYNEMYRNINVSEVNSEDYKVEYEIIQGENLFNGEDGFIIPDEAREMNALDVGERLDIETDKGMISGRIKGIYKSGGINTLNILKENVKYGEDISYYVKAKDGGFIDKLKNCSVVAVGDMGDRVAANISGFMKVFRILSVICLIGTILFNINMVYMNFIKDEQDSEMFIALGLGRKFVIRVQVIKMILLVILSSTLSLIIYYIMVNLFSAMMIDGKGVISLKIIIMNLLISIFIAIITFNVPLRRISKKSNLNLLREVN